MKNRITIVFIFILTFLIYFGVSTRFTFHPVWALDYFNQLAQSIIHGRFDIPNPSTTYDLVQFRGKWYAPWGTLSALFLIPIQLVKGRFVPSLYLNLIFGSLNVCIAYALIRRIRQEFYPDMSIFSVYALTFLFALGTTNFYVATLGSVWHVDQMVSSFFGNLGIWFVLKKKRALNSYVFSAWSICLTLLGRATISLLIILPALLFFYDYYLFSAFKQRNIFSFVKRGLLVFGIPIVLFTSLFFLYNFARFGNIFEYGYRYIREAPYLAQVRLNNGIMSIRNLPSNLWYMLFEIPKLTLDARLHFDFNLKGNSIFFLTPPFLAAFLASPFIRKGRKIFLHLIIGPLWATVIIVMVPSLLIYSTGWMQFGYRYTLDITLLLVMLSLFGMKGKLNVLYYGGIIFSILIYSWGIFLMQ